jgi:hypothetical protein|tara:strand:+ start:65 stop:730 length:666 start_codon:yes stop_codon:yes gene_type:complete
MKLSSDTINLLKNFADINPNILVKEGNKLSTISTMKNILAEADISESFDQEFAIYDLPEFLRSIDLFAKPKLEFNGGSNVMIADENSRQKIKYFFADKSVITAPSKSITMPESFVSFTLKKEMFEKLMKGVTTLNLPDVSVVGDGKNITLRASDRKNNTSNTYSVDVGESDKKFEAHYKAENFKLVTDDYDVAISSQKISHFTNRSRPVQYWIALEPDSTF